MIDIEITRQGGRWEVQVDGAVTSTHNEAKEGYENLIEQKLNNPGKVVELVPNFKVVATTNEAAGPSEELTLTDAEIETHVKTLPLFEEGNEYSYVLFEMTNEGISNVRPIKNITV